MRKRKPNKYWNEINCENEAKKYLSRIEFQKKSVSAYLSALRNGWLDKICKHMYRPIPHNKKWNFYTCKNEALKYQHKKDFYKHSMGAYLYAQRNDILNKICDHMIQQINWDKSLCENEALKYKTRTEFHKNSGSAYLHARKNKFLDEICRHMYINGNIKKRCIYAVEFENNYVYIGLTHSFNKRKSQHLLNNKSQVHKHIEKYNIYPKFKKLTKYHSIELAIELEYMYIEKYKKNNWNVLNIAKSGAIGGSTIKWTFENCQSEALKYKTKRSFQLNSCGAYSAAYRNNWLNIVCNHMKKTNYW